MLSASSTSGKFIARAIAQAMGLHSESPYSSPQKTTPSTLEERMPFAYAPNLVYLPNISNPYIPNWDFKWYKDIESGNFLNGIRVHHLPSGISANKIDSPRVELWEGGGGFEKDVYRSAEFCLMNSTVGGPNKVENAHDHFCPVCTNYITNLLSRTNNNVFDGPVTLLNQPLKFDEVNWVNKTIYIENSNININQNFNNQPINVATEYWTFNLESNSSIGIRLSNIKVKNQQRPEVRITEEVMEFIEFENIKILFENEQEPVDFPISEVFSNNKAKLEVYENGNNLQYDNLFQKGVKLTMKHDFEGTCDVTVVLSVVFRGREHDFDPGGAAYAAKFYPQIQFSWSPTQNNPRKVKSFIGHIVMDCNTHHAETNPTCLPTKTNFLELFTDSNTLITSVDQHFRKHKYRIKPSTLTPDDQAVVNPISQWSFLFDYYRAMVNSSGYQDPFDKTWTVVYGPLNNKAKTSRSTAMSFINEFSSKVDNNFVVNKVPRQGAYDNVHVTGDMGFHQPQTGMGSEPYLYEGSEVLIPARLLAAPFCAEDCIHIHFRWGAIAKYLAAVMRSDVSQFKGWYPDLENSLKGSASEQPLVPPNQEIKLRAINTNNRSKKIIYEAEIIKPYAGSQNVIFEQGAAFALEVHSSFVTLGLKLFFSSSPIFPALCPDGIDGALTLDDYVFMRKVYSRIRFVEPIPNSGGPLQVRTGVPKASDTDSTLESL